MTESKYDPMLLEGTYLFAFNRYEAKDWSEAVKWLSVVIEKDPDYNDAAVLLHKAKEELKQTEYESGRRALHDKNWTEAVDHFEKIVNLDGKYCDVALLLEDAKKGLQLPELYASVQEPLRQRDWNVAIPKLEEIVGLDKGFRDATFQLNWALRQRRVAHQYAEAQEQYTLAQQQDKEIYWKRAVALLEEVNRAQPGYQGVDRQLASARTHLKLVTHYKKGSRHLDCRQWLRATWHLHKAYCIDRTYGGVTDKLQQAKEGLGGHWRKGLFGISWRQVSTVVIGVVFTIALAIFANQMAGFGDSMIIWWHTSRVTPTTTVAIPGINRIEVWEDGRQLDLTRLPSLISGQAVELEVIVFDTNGKKYTSDELVCTWSVNPLSDGDVGIDTDLCRTLYLPSRKYSSQTIVVEAKGLEQQFEPIHPILMEFSITK